MDRKIEQRFASIENAQFQLFQFVKTQASASLASQAICAAILAIIAQTHKDPSVWLREEEARLLGIAERIALKFGGEERAAEITAVFTETVESIASMADEFTRPN